MRRLSEDYIQEIDTILSFLREERQRAAARIGLSFEETTDFRCLIDGVLFRVSVSPSIDGEQHALRKIDRTLHSLNELDIPANVVDKLLSIKSGLLLFSGRMGAGKTTTASAFIKDFLLDHPRTGMTIEDPPEKILQGWHGKHSQCIQREVPFKNFGKAITGTLRQNPDILFLGELREGHAIFEALNAASTGHVIVSTIHAGNEIETITRVIGRCAETIGMENSRALLADGLAAIIHQDLLFTGQRYLPRIKPLWVNETKEELSIRNIIRSGSLAGLKDQIHFQNKAAQNV